MAMKGLPRLINNASDCNTRARVLYYFKTHLLNTAYSPFKFDSSFHSQFQLFCDREWYKRTINMQCNVLAAKATKPFSQVEKNINNKAVLVKYTGKMTCYLFFWHVIIFAPISKC